jgi:hypothetical protein
MGQCKSQHRDFKKDKENMGQCESKERDFKEYKRSKVLKKDFRIKVLKTTEEKKQSK